MNKENLLKNIADTAYNVGFGAKKHFATFDIVDKSPGLISFLVIAFGIYALAIDSLSTDFLSATFIVLGISGLYISFLQPKKDEYENAGIELTKLYNRLYKLYIRAKDSEEKALQDLLEELEEIESSYYSISISKQILLSDWYAHYKFFWQHQIDWVDEQKNFNFFRDKVPLSLSLTLILLIAMLIYWFLDLQKFICS